MVSLNPRAAAQLFVTSQLELQKHFPRDIMGNAQVYFLYNTMSQVYYGINEFFVKWFEKFTLPYSIVSMGKYDTVFPRK